MDDVVNVCFKSVVSCAKISCVTVDGLGIDNLLSSDVSEREKGLQVETFIRPPVSLSITFKIPLSITHFLIKPQLGPNDICKIGLSTSESASDTAVPRKRDFGGVYTVSGTSPLVLYNKLLHKTRYSPNDIALHNKVVGSLLCAKLLGQQISLQPLSATHATRTVVINFMHWSGPRALTLKSLELWGKLCPNARPEHRKVFEELKGTLMHWNHSLHNKKTMNVAKLYNTGAINEDKDEVTVVTSQSTHRSQNEEEVPLEFTDSLTYNIMTLPVLLPSGHYVDQSTVDKSSALDIAYGRPPTDPFTGVPYIDPPQFCPLLKAKIDHYVSCHQPTLSVTERTVGSADDIIQHRTRFKRNARLIGRHEDLQSQEEMQPVKRRKLDSFRPSDTEASETATTSHSESDGASQRMNDHEKMIKDSLDNALNSLYPSL